MPRGGHGKAAKKFIKSIPNSKLEVFADTAQTSLWDDVNYHLDNQGLTSGDPKKVNLHVQICNSVQITSLQGEKGETISDVQVPLDENHNPTWDPEKIKEELIKRIRKQSTTKL